MRKNITLAGAAIVLLLAAACSSGGIGDILGGGSSTGNGTYATQVRGTVDSIDTNSQSILLTNVSANGSMLSSGNWPAYYNGATYSVSNLEVGDEIDVRMNGNYAQDITVTRSMSATNGSYPNGTTNPNGSTYPSNGQYSTVRGTIRYVDTTN